MNGALRLTRVHVRLTRPGTLYIVLTIVLGGVAVNAANNLLYLAVAALLALMSVSGILAYLNIRGLSAVVHPPDEIFAGRPVGLTVDIRNQKRLFPSMLIMVGAPTAGHAVLLIPPGGSAPVRIEKVFPGRGRQPLGELMLLSPFPFGLVLRGGSFDPGITCLVYPAPRAVPWRFVSEAEYRGEGTQINLAGMGGDHRGLRDYLPGDSLSRIHWKGWLRHRRLMTREFDAEGGPPVMLDFQAMPGPGTEERLGQLAWLVRTELRRDRAVGLRLPGSSLPPGSGSGHRRRLLTALALHGGADAP